MPSSSRRCLPPRPRGQTCRGRHSLRCYRRGSSRSSRCSSASCCADPCVPGPPYCTYRPRVPASCVAYAPEAQGSWCATGTYAVSVPALAVRTACRGTTGQLPPWLPLTLQSMAYNPGVSFIVIGDAAPPALLPPNVHFETVSYSAMQARLSLSPSMAVEPGSALLTVVATDTEATLNPSPIRTDAGAALASAYARQQQQRALLLHVQGQRHQALRRPSVPRATRPPRLVGVGRP